MKQLTGIELIAQERKEQIEKHGWTIEKDVELNDGYQLIVAASGLLTPNPTHSPEAEPDCPPDWDPEIWEKMINKPYRERLIIAGALIAAEIDRLDAE